MQVDFARPILMVTGDNQTAAHLDQTTGDIETLLQSGGFNHPFTAGAARPCKNFFYSRVVCSENFTGTRSARNFARKGPARQGKDARSRARRQLNQQRADETAADEGDRLIVADLTTAKNIHRAAERLPRENLAALRRRD